MQDEETKHVDTVAEAHQARISHRSSSFTGSPRIGEEGTVEKILTQNAEILADRLN